MFKDCHLIINFLVYHLSIHLISIGIPFGYIPLFEFYIIVKYTNLNNCLFPLELLNLLFFIILFLFLFLLFLLFYLLLFWFFPIYCNNNLLISIVFILIVIILIFVINFLFGFLFFFFNFLFLIFHSKLHYFFQHFHFSFFT